MSTPNLVLCETADPGLPGIESYSPFCLKVHRALKVAGLPYERRHGLPASFKRYNPVGQVPVLLVDGEPLADSTDILRRIVQLKRGAFAADAEA
jgi:glutathione S-transferase